jgi:hypothetical protein
LIADVKHEYVAPLLVDDYINEQIGKF